MKILVIGGTRFIGYHLVRILLADGHEVTVFNRGRSPDEFGKEVRRIRGDRNDRADFYAKLHQEKFDVVADMIAFRAEDSRSAVETFAGRVGHFFHISTGAVYVVTRDYPSPLREEDFDRELFPRPKKNADWWLYGFQKRECEEVLREAHLKRQFPVTILRPPIALGERDYTLRAYSYFLRLEDGQPLVLPDAGLNAFTQIYAGDIVRTVASNLLCESAFGQAYNVAQDEILTLRGFVLAAARILNHRPDLVDIPADVLERTSLGTSFSPFSNRRPFILSTAKARRDLGFSPTPFETWLEKTILWFKYDYGGGPPENYETRNREIQIAARYRAAVAHLEL
ncbi:MAG: NAD-dependent epimerase/dehydratase family protein [Acidobacteriota bacterium]